jgi:hypothetical protein
VSLLGLFKLHTGASTKTTTTKKHQNWFIYETARRRLPLLPILFQGIFISHHRNPTEPGIQSLNQHKQQQRANEDTQPPHIQEQKTHAWEPTAVTPVILLTSLMLHISTPSKSRRLLTAWIMQCSYDTSDSYAGVSEKKR